MQKRILTPTTGTEDWKGLLAKPDLHWKPGRSAILCTSAFESISGLPHSIRDAFDASDTTGGHSNLELLVAIPEYQTALDGGNAGSQSDVFCLVRAALGVIALTVEAKVDESFGPTIAGWKTKTSERGGAARWSQMCSKLGVGTDWPELVRYQLLHRLAAAVIEQERFGTKVAAMVVQSFCADDRLNGFKDFCNFAGHMGVVEVQKNRMYRTRAEGCPKLIGWVQEPTDNLGVAPE